MYAVHVRKQGMSQKSKIVCFVCKSVGLRERERARRDESNDQTQTGCNHGIRSV